MNVFIITYFSYKDGLTQAYTLPYILQLRELLPSSSKIHFTTLDQQHLALTREEKNQIKKDLNSKGIEITFFKWRGSGVSAGLSWIRRIAYLWGKILFGGYHVIHAWNTPSGVFGFILSILTGKKLVVDSYEPHAEPMVESGTWKENSLLFKILFQFEKLQSKRATLVISCVEKMREYALDKYKTQFQYFLHKPACVDLQKFDFNLFDRANERKKLGLKPDDIVCVYAGKIGGTYLGIEIFKLFQSGYERWKNRFKVVLLGKYDESLLQCYAEDLNIPESVIKSYFVDHREVPRYLSVADFALTPFVPVPSKRYGSPIKTGEYMAMGLPQIISKDISDDSDLIKNENLGYVIDEWVGHEFDKALTQIESMLENIEAEKRRIRDLASKHKHFNISKEVYSEYINILSSIS